MDTAEIPAPDPILYADFLHRLSDIGSLSAVPKFTLRLEGVLSGSDSWGGFS